MGAGRREEHATSIRGRTTDGPGKLLREINAALVKNLGKTTPSPPLAFPFPASSTRPEQWNRGRSDPFWVGCRLLGSVPSADPGTTVVLDGGICTALGERQRAGHGLSVNRSRPRRSAFLNIQGMTSRESRVSCRMAPRCSAQPATGLSATEPWPCRDAIFREKVRRI